jgi:hypothetical protein
MICKQGKSVPTAPSMPLSEYEAAVAAFIRNKGVTRCPTACLVRTQASVPVADREALEQYEAGRAQSRRTNLATTAKLLGVFAPPNGNASHKPLELSSREAQTTRSQCSAAISVSS